MLHKRARLLKNKVLIPRLEKKELGLLFILILINIIPLVNSVTTSGKEEYIGDSPKKQQKSGGIVSLRGIHCWTQPENNLSSDIPDEIANVLSEAATILIANCPRVSAVMSWRTLVAITVEKGEAKGSLADRLKTVVKKVFFIHHYLNGQERFGLSEIKAHILSRLMRPFNPRIVSVPPP